MKRDISFGPWTSIEAAARTTQLAVITRPRIRTPGITLFSCPASSNVGAVGLWAGLQGVAQTRKLARGATDRIDSTRISRDLIQALLVGWGAKPALASRVIDLTEFEGFARASSTTRDYLESLGDLENLGSTVEP